VKAGRGGLDLFDGGITTKAESPPTKVAAAMILNMLVLTVVMR
jgi:hypothetical protein